VSSDASPRTPAGRGRNTVSNIFAFAAVVFAVIAIVLYFRGPSAGPGVAPIPTAAPESNQIVNVTEALKAQGLSVEQPPGLFVPRRALSVPGQGVEINGNPGFIFLYDGADAASADVADVDPGEVVPERVGGQPAPAGERRLTQGSNVAVLMIGGDDATWQRVETAVGSLP
jgi:hypothetical protein